MCKEKLEKPMLAVEDFSKAETDLIRYSQRQMYAEEIKALQHGNTHVSRNTSNFTLDPYLQNDVL